MRSLLCFLAIGAGLNAQPISLDDPSKNMELKHVTSTVGPYRGAKALNLTEQGGSPTNEALAILKGVEFHNGTIEVDVAGSPAAGSDAGARGFIGVAFRVPPGAARYEEFYIRPTNGRAPDQLRRNHATQYVSIPEWPWHRLREQFPGVYESYADLVAGEWTHLKIEVQGKSASLYAGSATQPSLIVPELKLGDSRGGVALWIGPGTEGHFKELKVSNQP